MKKLLLLWLILFVLIVSLYSSPKITFEKEVHNFGDIKEEGGPYEYDFIFSNTGDEPLKIIKVKASWGCTSPSWSTGSINPGEKGFVNVKYTSENRPGGFGKSITVTSNAENNIVTLKVKGKVIPTPGKFRTKYRIGNLYLDKRSITFGKIKDTEFRIDSINTWNTGNESLEIIIETEIPYLQIATEPSILKPQEKGKIIFKINAQQIDKYGDIKDDIQVVAVTKSNKMYGDIPVIATIEEDFSHLTEKDLANAPIIKFNDKNINLGSIKKGEKKYCEFKFSNEGKRDLIIRNIQQGRDYTIVDFDNEIKPGDSGKIEIVFQTNSNLERYKKTISVISNDPKNPVTYLSITGKGQKRSTEHKKAIYENIPPEKAFVLIEEYHSNDELVILDVRTPDEFCKKHIKNAVNLDFRSENFEKIISILDKSRFYLVYCEKGKRSGETVELMKKLGFDRTLNMEEGIIGWEKRGYPLVEWEISKRMKSTPDPRKARRDPRRARPSSFHYAVTGPSSFHYAVTGREIFNF